MIVRNPNNVRGRRPHSDYRFRYSLVCGRRGMIIAIANEDRRPHRHADGRRSNARGARWAAWETRRKGRMADMSPAMESKVERRLTVGCIFL